MLRYGMAEVVPVLDVWLGKCLRNDKKLFLNSDSKVNFVK